MSEKILPCILPTSHCDIARDCTSSIDGIASPYFYHPEKHELCHIYSVKLIKELEKKFGWDFRHYKNPVGERND